MMMKSFGRSKAALGLSFAAALLMGIVLSPGVADTKPEGIQSEDSVLTWDSNAETALEGGITLEEYESAIGRVRECMGEEAAGFMRGPSRDVSGLLPVYGLEADSSAMLDFVGDKFDKCYDSILLKIEMEYQLSVADAVDEYYAEFNLCAEAQFGREAITRSPIALELLPEKAASTYVECLSK